MTATTSTDLSRLHRRSVERFTRQVEDLRSDDWIRPTPCPEWNVRDLVNHVTVEDLWTPPLLAGRTITDVGHAFDGDRLGAVPTEAARDAAAGAITAVAAPGALTRTVHLSSGETPASEYVWQLTTDHLIHSWDLARAVGGDDLLDPEQVSACALWFAAHEDAYRASGAIGPRAPTAADADPQTRLLAAFGRPT